MTPKKTPTLAEDAYKWQAMTEPALAPCKRGCTCGRHAFGPPAPAPAEAPKEERRANGRLNKALTSALMGLSEYDKFDDNHWIKNAIGLARGVARLGDVGDIRRGGKPAPAPASVGVNPAVRDIHSPPNRLAICKQGVPGCSGDGSYAKPHDGSVHMAFNAPASVTPVHFGVGGCPPLCNIFSDGYRHEPPCVHAENPPRTIINVSVTPASDEDVSEWKQWGGEFTRLCARIEQEKAANAELRAVAQFWKNQTKSIESDIPILSARLAEVSEKATELVTAWDAGWALKSELEAILAKGDK